MTDAHNPPATSKTSIPKRKYFAEVENHEETLRSIDYHLSAAKNECDAVMQVNKRLKLELAAVKDKDESFWAANDTLTHENVDLRAQLELEKDQSATLREEQNRLAKAMTEHQQQIHKAETEASAKAKAKFEVDWKSLQMELQQAKARARKAQAERNELVEKQTTATQRLGQEKKRADDAEAKLASILAVFGKAA